MYLSYWLRLDKEPKTVISDHGKGCYIYEGVGRIRKIDLDEVDDELSRWDIVEC